MAFQVGYPDSILGWSLDTKALLLFIRRIEHDTTPNVEAVCRRVKRSTRKGA
jgi:hypothetical protein